MTNDRGIFIKNIYYMLSYAFKVLKQSNYENISSENFEKIEDLFAEILSLGISKQLKQGLYREYINKNDNFYTFKGKLNIYKTMNNQIHNKKKISCEFDILSENNIYNQILKTTVIALLKNKLVGIKYKKSLKKIVLFFDNIDVIDLSKISWRFLKFHKNNRTYEMLINICYFISKNFIQTTEKGNYKMMNFSDEQMARLYEKFILEYYRYHHPYLKPCSLQIKWNLDDGGDENIIKFLPTMKTDITLQYMDKKLIIDAKYYSNIMKLSYDKKVFLSNNLYQIFSYVKNLDVDRSGKVAGMLLYAKTSEYIENNGNVSVDGNKIFIKTLDLNKEFKSISNQLDNIVVEYFGNII